MQLFGFNHSKCKTQCRLGVGRIKLLRNKKQLQMKGLRKEVAELMRQGKQGNARIRVEAVMREHRMLQAYEILELYLELLAVRAELLAKTRDIPPDMAEAICSLIYAGERVSTDLAEINAVAKLLTSKYSSVGAYKDAGFPHEVVSDLTCRKWQVNDDLVTCLAVTAPNAEEKLAFLEDIATELDVPFDRDAAALDMLPASGKPSPMAYPVETLRPAGGGPAAGSRQQQPPLAQSWHPPAEAPPPPATAQQPAGWHPQQQGNPGNPPRLDKLMSGGFVVRPGAAAGPGFTDLPSASEGDGGGDGLAWQPPAPEDFNSKGRSFVKHVDAAANWRQTRLHGPTTSSSSGSAGGGDPVQDEFINPERAELPGGGAGWQQPPGAAAWQQPGSAWQQQQGQGQQGQVDRLEQHSSGASVTSPGGEQLPPGTAHSSGGSTPIMGNKPMTPKSSYADASAAAEAAKRYSHMAQQAAAKAEEFAASQAAGKKGSGAAPGSSGGSGGTDGSSGSDGGGGGGGSGQQFVPRTLSEIKRAYDAAPGPPAKPGAGSASGPPSAPPAPGAGPDAAVGTSLSPTCPPPAAGVPPPGGQAGGAGAGQPHGDIPDLPSVPTAGQGGPPPVEDELDELTRRFEMLKRR